MLTKCSVCIGLLLLCGIPPISAQQACDTNNCAQTRFRTTPEILAHIPWTTSPWIVRDLAKSSTLPYADLLYEVIIDSELRMGPVGHSGVMGDPTQKSNYNIWWDLNDNPDTHQSHLRIWLDEKGIVQSMQDLDAGSVKLPVAETVNFYEDHWDQTTAKGTFSGKVEPFPPAGQGLASKSPFRTTPEILVHIPWTTSPWLGRELAKNSTLPYPDLLYDVIINSELRAGPVGHSGVVGDPTQKSRYNIWWDLDDNPATHESHLKIWLDDKGVVQSIQDLDMGSVKLPVAETASFYEDHWEQTTAKGNFSGKVEPFPPATQARVDSLK